MSAAIIGAGAFLAIIGTIFLVLARLHPEQARLTTTRIRGASFLSIILGASLIGAVLVARALS